MDETSFTEENVEEFIAKPTSELSSCEKKEVTERFHDENTKIKFGAVDGVEIQLLGDTETYASDTNNEAAVKCESNPNLPSTLLLR